MFMLNKLFESESESIYLFRSNRKAMTQLFPTYVKFT